MQLVYGYVETDDDNDDEIDRNRVPRFKDKGTFTCHTTQTWYEMDMSLISQYVHTGWKADSVCTNSTFNRVLKWALHQLFFKCIIFILCIWDLNSYMYSTYFNAL